MSWPLLHGGGIRLIDAMSVNGIYLIALDLVRIDIRKKVQFAYDRNITDVFSMNVDPDWLDMTIWRHYIETDEWDELLDFIEDCVRGESQKIHY